MPTIYTLRDRDGHERNVKLPGGGLLTQSRVITNPGEELIAIDGVPFVPIQPIGS